MGGYGRFCAKDKSCDVPPWTLALLGGASLPSGHKLSHQAGTGDRKAAPAHKDLLE